MRLNLTLALVAVSLLALTDALAAQEKASVKELISKAASGTKKSRIEAIDELGHRGADANDGVATLTKALGNDDKDIRWHAARALGGIGAGAEPAVAALSNGLTDDTPQVRAYCAFALGRIGKPAEAAVDHLVKTVFDKDPLVRRATVRAILQINPDSEKIRPLFLQVLEKGDNEVILPAIATLAEEGKAAVPRMIKALEDERACYWACVVLQAIGPDAVDAVPAIAKYGLSHDDPDVRLQALVTLGTLGESAKAAADGVVKAFENDPFVNVRYAAAYALGRMKVQGKGEEALRKAMDGDDEFLRTIAAWAIGRANPDDQKVVNRAVSIILASFKSDNVDVRRAAARAVVEFDVEPAKVAPALIAALEDGDSTVVANAIEALANYGAEALDHVDDALDNEKLRPYAIMLITRMGSKAEPAVPALMKHITADPKSDDEAMLVREVQFALAAIGPKAKPAMPALVKSLSSDRDEIRASAAFALGKIGPDARAAVPALRKSFQSESPIVKLASIRALLEIQPKQRNRLAVSAIPLLVQALKSEQELIRAEAATALGEIGRLPPPVAAALKKLLNDESDLVKQAVQEALERARG